MHLTNLSVSYVNKPRTAQVGAPLKVHKNQVFQIYRDTIVRIVKLTVVENTWRDTHEI